MNAKGISTFYGATAPAISIAEVRPPVGSRVAVGCFDIIRPVRLLDVAAFEELLVEGSIFDPSFAPKLERARFLRRLSERITMPVMPEEEGERHLVTQAMADYLAGEESLKLDGILYRSAQSDVSGHNVVLFHNAARCDAIDLPRGAEVTGQTGMHTEDGYETDYCVWEEVPVDTKASEKEDWLPRIHLPPLFGDRTEDSRPMTLRLDAQSLMVHHVSAVSFTTETFEVRRHRFEKRDRPKF